MSSIHAPLPLSQASESTIANSYLSRPDDTHDGIGKLGIYRINAVLKQLDNTSAQLDELLDSNHASISGRIQNEFTHFAGILQMHKKQIQATFFGSNPTPAYGTEDFPILNDIADKIQGYLEQLASKLEGKPDSETAQYQIGSISKSLEQLQQQIDAKFLPKIFAEESVLNIASEQLFELHALDANHQAHSFKAATV